MVGTIAACYPTALKIAGKSQGIVITFYRYYRAKAREARSFKPSSKQNEPTQQNPASLPLPVMTCVSRFRPCICFRGCWRKLWKEMQRKN